MAETPVDISKLAGILNKSKAVLDSVERTMGPSGDGGTYSKQSVREGKTPPMPGNMLDSSKMLTSLPQGQSPGNASDPTKAIRHTLKNAKTTKMPKEIVEAMISNPIIPPSETTGGDLDPDLIKMINPNYGNTKKPVVESVERKETVTDNGDLKSLIREVVEEIIVERKVDEQLQIRVGDTIFTGKITKSKSINK